MSDRTVERGFRSPRGTLPHDSYPFRHSLPVSAKPPALRRTLRTLLLLPPEGSRVDRLDSSSLRNGRTGLRQMLPARRSESYSATPHTSLDQRGAFGSTDSRRDSCMTPYDPLLSEASGMLARAVTEPVGHLGEWPLTPQRSAKKAYTFRSCDMSVLISPSTRGRGCGGFASLCLLQ